MARRRLPAQPTPGCCRHGGALRCLQANMNAVARKLQRGGAKDANGSSIAITGGIGAGSLASKDSLYTMGGMDHQGGQRIAAAPSQVCASAG